MRRLGTSVLAARLPREGLWRDPDFLRLWGGQTISLIGSQVTVLALPLTAVLTLRATPFQMGVLRAAQYAPFIVLGLLVGVWVDRMRRRPVLIAADAARALLLLSVPAAWLLGRLSMQLLYGTAVGLGVLTLLFDVSYLSYLPRLVASERLTEGNSKLQLSRSVADTAGPGLAGLLVQALGAPAALLVDAASFVVSALSLARIRRPEPAPGPAQDTSVWSEAGEGLRALLSNPLLRTLTGTLALNGLFANVEMAVLVLYMSRERHLGAPAIGVIFAALGPGAVVGALVAPAAMRRLGMGPVLVGARILDGAGNVLLPLAGGPPLVAGLVFGAAFVTFGLVGPISSITSTTLVQSSTPDRLLGRVAGTFRFLFWGTAPAGSLLGGALGAAIGLRPTLVVATLGMLGALAWLLASPVRSLREAPGRSSAE